MEKLGKMAKVKKERNVLIGLFLLLLLGNYTLKNSTSALYFYINYISLPLQKIKNKFFDLFQFSLGDIVYAVLLLVILFLTIKVIWRGIKYQQNLTGFWQSVIRLIGLILLAYFFFFISWGGNYYRPPLSHQWTKGESISWNKDKLLKLNEFLVLKLNKYAGQEIEFPDNLTVNRLANDDYHQLFGSKVPQLKVKPTLLGDRLNFLGASGYYNPLTGEGQFNEHYPKFMLPFLITHEMAHQTGIAAEYDANLLAYIIGVQSNNLAFKYSAYFNLWLYAFPELRLKDSVRSKELWGQLNPKVKADLESLRAIWRQYRGTAQDLSNRMYDDYLKANGQINGLDSYDDVVLWGYYWEFIKKRRIDLKLYPPL